LGPERVLRSERRGQHKYHERENGRDQTYKSRLLQHLDINRREVVAHSGLPNFFAEINTRAAKSDSQSTSHGSLGIAGIGAQMVGMIAPQNSQGEAGVEPHSKSRDDHKQCREPRGYEVSHVIQPCGELAKIEVTLRAIADH